MNYWMIMKWNELVMGYNIGMMNGNMNNRSIDDLLDRYEDDVNIFYSIMF